MGKLHPVKTRRALLIAALAAGLALAAVGTASGTNRLAKGSTLFISRGDVITYVGKAGLVPTPVITHVLAWNQSWTCTYEDGTTVPVSAVVHDAVLYYGQARTAPGNDTITGYTVGAPFDAFADPVPCAISLEGHGVSTQQTLVSSTLASDQTLFQNVPIPVPFGA